jgi:hypothetical protein
MPRIAPATFLKLISARPEQRLRDLLAYEKPGDGYDGHRNLRLAVSRGVSDGSLDGLHDALARIPVIEERRRALRFEPAIRKRLRAEGSQFVLPPRKVWESPRRQFSIDLHPDVGIQQGNHRLFAFLYFHGSVRPSRTTAGALIALATRALSSEMSEADEIAVIDVVGNKTFKAVYSLSRDLLANSIDELDNWFASRGR